VVLITASGRRAYVFMAESCDVGNDSDELQLLKARTVRGVSQVNQRTGQTIIHIQSLGRGPIQCEQELKEAMA
jgi:hypothetical protein